MHGNKVLSAMIGFIMRTISLLSGQESNNKNKQVWGRDCGLQYSDNEIK